ncbi:MAG: MFS transporter, partial [Pseudomonadota bacterium]
MSQTETQSISRGAAFGICTLLVLASLLSFAGTDLVLPAIPTLPEVLGGSPATAQFVVATYIAGFAIGLLIFGALGRRFRKRTLLIVALGGFALMSAAAALVSNVELLIVIRFFQGALSAAPAAYGPGIIKALFSERGATQAIGVLGSVESLAPAIGPIIGAWLLGLGGWRLSFLVTAVGAGLAALAFTASLGALPASQSAGRGSYLALLRSPVYLRYALSQAFVVGGLLSFVFGAPAVIVRVMEGELEHFIAMQVAG